MIYITFQEYQKNSNDKPKLQKWVEQPYYHNNMIKNVGLCNWAISQIHRYVKPQYKCHSCGGNIRFPRDIMSHALMGNKFYCK